MATYAIGDVQGCFVALQKLLTHIQFNIKQDTLWFTGDLVNRGPQSLEVLRFIRALGERQCVVLGNHDLHLIAVAYGIRDKQPQDTLDAILTAPDKEELIDWLRHRPFLHHDARTGFVMTHAGLAPCWTLAEAESLAKEVETVLQSDAPHFFLKQMYGNLPDQWTDHLSGIERLRCITNYFTRMRFCEPDGRLMLSYKGNLREKPAHLVPWFNVTTRVNKQIKIIFGHFAALDGESNTPFVYALDTGCVWGNCLTALRLEDEQRFKVKC